MREQVIELVMSWSGAGGVPDLLRTRAQGQVEIVHRLISPHGGILLEDIDSVLLEAGGGFGPAGSAARQSRRLRIDARQGG
jgi:hypothetical protein